MILDSLARVTKFDPFEIQWRVPWGPVPAEHNEGTIAELRREIPAGHILNGRSIQTVGRRQDCDDVLFYLGESKPQFAVVHLTYQKETNPGWPNTWLYDSLQVWVEQCLIPDAKDWNS